ncbi:trafficking protein particle complex subunit 2, putative (TRAPPC2) [Plasmodium ovale curtisi]|nr:trafficking protein particle complex subunit 2, putative (TRAPPC2) [Plasmodium ovale curtisi]
MDLHEEKKKENCTFLIIPTKGSKMNRSGGGAPASMYQVYVLTIIGKGDIPMYEADLSINGKKEISEHLAQFIIHQSLDSLDELVWKNSNLFLKTIDSFNNYSVSAYCTPGHIKFMLLYKNKNEANNPTNTNLYVPSDENIRAFFEIVHENYIKVLSSSTSDIERDIGIGGKHRLTTPPNSNSGHAKRTLNGKEKGNICEGCPVCAPVFCERRDEESVLLQCSKLRKQKKGKTSEKCEDNAVTARQQRGNNAATTRQQRGNNAATTRQQRGNNAATTR